MSQSEYDNDRETIWGIIRRDRRWFQVLTMTGGTACSVALTVLQLKYRSSATTPDMLMLNILLGIGASFVASGFIAWELLQMKELAMAIADWIRERNARNREKLREEGRAEGREEGIREGYTEGYGRGYDDARQGKPRQDTTDKPNSSP